MNVYQTLEEWKDSYPADGICRGHHVAYSPTHGLVAMSDYLDDLLEGLKSMTIPLDTVIGFMP